MEILFTLGIGVFTAAGVWLMLRARTFDVILGLTLLSYAVNLFIAAMGRLTSGAAPLVPKGAERTLAEVADPLPQALVLTAIVIGFAMTAVLIVIALRSRAESGNDHVDVVEEVAGRTAAEEAKRSEQA